MYDIENYDVYSQGFGEMTDTEQILASINTPDTITSKSGTAPPVTEQQLTQAATKPVTLTSLTNGLIPATIFGIDTGKLLGYTAGAIVLYIMITSFDGKKKKKRKKY
jgi:hypothetical protein